jgi:hypothetical protein
MHGEDVSLKSHLTNLETFQTKMMEQYKMEQASLHKLSQEFKKHTEKSSHQLTLHPTVDVLPCMVSYGNKAVGFLHTLSVLHKLCVAVISEDSWTWVLSWAQVGLKAAMCVSLMTKAQCQLEPVVELLEGQVSFNIFCGLDSALVSLTRDHQRQLVVCSHVVSSNSGIQLTWLNILPPKCMVLLYTLPSLEVTMRQFLPTNAGVQVLWHQ